MQFHLFVCFLKLVLQIARPLLLSRVLRYFSDDPRIDYYEACYSAAGVCLCTVAIILIDYPSVQESMAVSIQMKTVTCALIYQKSLRLSQSALGQTQVGQIINLLSNDVKRIDAAAFYLVFLIIVPIQTLITVYILWIYLGFASLAGMAILVLLIPVQAKISQYAANFRIRVAKLTDLRLKYMNEIISGMKVIKMYCWERPFAGRVTENRK
jgi:ATP-binding cassette, subfamily C (CFTR/MRP), member 4